MPRYATLGAFMEALKKGEIERSKVEIKELTCTGAVVVSLQTGEDDWKPIYETDTLETFLIEFGEALGIKAYIS